ncbi:MAG: phytanoyl-CoA dioxygenase family protein [Acidimicrobiales bacterium]
MPELDRVAEQLGVPSASARETTVRELVQLRFDAFGEVRSRGVTPDQVPTPSGNKIRLLDGIPTVSAEDLDAQAVVDGIGQAGCLRVRSLFNPSQIESLKAGIDTAFAARESKRVADPWHQVFLPANCSDSQLSLIKVSRRACSNPDYGALLLADSPRMLQNFVEISESSGLTNLVHRFLGERPAISVNKATLRVVSRDIAGGDWHQDGSFMGTPLQTLNSWIPLSDCGQTAPGMDLVPLRLDGLVPTGELGAWFPWSVSPREVRDAAQDTPIVRPVFEAGDILLFDELMLHRTAATQGLSSDRYAIECWWFAPSGYPLETQVPLLV